MTLLDDPSADATTLVGPARRVRTVRWSPALVASSLAGVLHLLWWRLLATPGGDIAAQDAWAAFAKAHPGSAYDLAWYGGMHPVSYSAISPYLMAFLGVRPTMVVAGTLAAGLLAVLLERSRHVSSPMLPAVFGALALTGNAVSGRVTFGLGLLFGLAALVAVYTWPTDRSGRAGVALAAHRGGRRPHRSRHRGQRCGGPVPRPRRGGTVAHRRPPARLCRRPAAGRGGRGVGLAVPALRRAADGLELRDPAHRRRSERAAAVPARLAVAASPRPGLPGGRPAGVADALARRHQHQPARADLRRCRTGGHPARARLGAVVRRGPLRPTRRRRDGRGRPDHLDVLAGRARRSRRHQHRPALVAEPRPPAPARPAPGARRRPRSRRGGADGEPPRGGRPGAVRQPGPRLEPPGGRRSQPSSSTATAR